MPSPWCKFMINGRGETGCSNISQAATPLSIHVMLILNEHFLLASSKTKSVCMQQKANEPRCINNTD